MKVGDRITYVDDLGEPHHGLIETLSDRGVIHTQDLFFFWTDEEGVAWLPGHRLLCGRAVQALLAAHRLNG